MVLESVVSLVLNQVLSAYVANFNTKQLNVGIWGGDIKLNFILPEISNLSVARWTSSGYTGGCGGKFDWKSSLNRTMDSSWESIASGNEFDPEEDNRRKQAAKMEMLKNAELLLTASSGTLASPDSTTHESNKNESFIAVMTNNIFDSLQLWIKNVHIRYEDGGTYVNGTQESGYRRGYGDRNGGAFGGGRG